MKKKLIFTAAATALALNAQVSAITLANTWTTGNNGTLPVLSGESATGFTAATSKGAWMYQLASADFASEAFNIGDTATMSFTTTLNADAVSDPLDFRIAMWDEVNGGGASVRMDWGPLTGANVAGIGAGDNMSPTAIGSYDNNVMSGALMPTSVFDVNGSTVDVLFSVTKATATTYDMSLTWDDMTFSTTTALANGTDDPMNSISGIGIRINAAAGNDNNFTVSNLQVDVVPEPSTFALLAVFGFGLIGRRRR